MSLPISATVITLNEEKNIAACIENLKQVCREVIVLDSGSKDKTREIAKRSDAIVHIQEYLGDGLQKNKVSEYASYNWILSIDADERLDRDSIEWIPRLNFDDPKVGYAFRRKNYIADHWIKAGGFYPDIKLRLYNRNFSRYVDSKKHAYVICQKVKKLPCSIIHQTYRDYAHWIEKINFLSSRDAWAHQHKKVSVATIFTHTLATFIRKFFLKGGIFQGLDGWTVTLTTCFKTYMKYLKIKELQQKQHL